IGGYNPVNWSGFSKYIETNDSFIFSFQSILNPSTTILSRVKDGENAIYDSMYDYHGFGDHDLRIFNKSNQTTECAKYETKIIKTKEPFGCDKVIVSYSVVRINFLYK